MHETVLGIVARLDSFAGPFVCAGREGSHDWGRPIERPGAGSAEERLRA